MNRICFVLCPQWDITLPPLGQAALATFIRQAGFEVRVFDFNVEAFNNADADLRYLWDIAYQGDYWLNRRDFENNPALKKDFFISWRERIHDEHPQIIVFTIYLGNFLTSLKLVKEIREKDKKVLILMGGPEFMNEKSREMAFKEGGVDGIGVGEGELTLLEIVQNYLERGILSPTPSAFIKINGEIKWSREQEPIMQLDSLPYPDYDFYHLLDYQQRWTMPIQGSRGCISRCAYCAPTNFWKRFRSRSAENIFSEMTNLFKKYGTYKFYFTDSLLNGNIKVLDRLCDLIIESGLSFKWYGFARIRRDMSLEFLKKMRKAGCHELTYGVESCSQKVQNLMNKKIKVEEIEEVLNNTRRAGILVKSNFIVGFPGENEKDFQETRDFLNKNRKCFDKVGGVFSCILLEGSEIERSPEKYAILKGETNVGWQTKTKDNTPEIRERRCRELKKTVKKLKLDLLDQADSLNVQGDFQNALKLYQELEKIYPPNSYLLGEISRCLMKIGHLDLATSYATKAIEKSMEEADLVDNELYLLRAELYFKKQMWVEAINDHLAAKKAGANSEKVDELLAICWQNAQLFDQGFDYFAQKFNSNKKYWKTLFYLAKFSSLCGKFEEADRYFSLLMEMVKDLPLTPQEKLKLYLEHAELLVQCGKEPQAEALFQKIELLTIFPLADEELKYNFYQQYGKLLLKMGKFDLAKEILEQGLVMAINSGKEKEEGEIYLKLGDCFMELKDYKRAIDAFRRAEEKGIKFKDFGFALGYCYRSSGLFKQGIAAFKKSYKGDKDKLIANIELGRLYSKVDQAKKAIKLFKRIILELEAKTKGESDNLRQLIAEIRSTPFHFAGILEYMGYYLQVNKDIKFAHRAFALAESVKKEI